MWNLDTERTRNVHKVPDNEADGQGFEGMVTAKEVTTSGICGELGEVQRICEDGDEAVPTTIVIVIKLVREGIKVERKIATMPSQQTDLECELVETRAAERTIRRHCSTAIERVTTLKAQLFNAQMALEKLAIESSKTGADLRAEMVAVEELLDAKKSRVKSLERELATDVDRIQQLLTER